MTKHRHAAAASPWTGEAAPDGRAATLVNTVAKADTGAGDRLPRLA